MNQISNKEASTKYGIIISKMQIYNKYKFFLLENGDVIDSDGDIRYENPFKDWNKNLHINGIKI